MSARKERLEGRLSALRVSAAQAAVRRHAGWPVYAAVTGSALALSANSGTPGTFPEHSPQAAISLKIPRPRTVRLAMAVQSAAVNAAQAAPSILAGGVVPVYGTANTIQPGEWVSIYGSNLASGSTAWKGDFPTALGGTTVTINGKAAYLSLVSPGQINLQAPDDTATGEVSVVVTTAAGSASAMVVLAPTSPAFLLSDSSHVAAIIVRLNGAYDILGPTGDCFGYPTVAAAPGDVVELFGVGFGPTNPPVPAGKPYSGAAPITQPFSLYINAVLLTPTFVGMSSAGLYQVNVVIPPGLGEGDVPIQAFVGGLSTQSGLSISLLGSSTTTTVCAYPTGDGGVGGSGDGGSGDGGTGDGGSGDGGSGDGGGGGDGGGDGGGGDGGDGDGG